ncbi:DUF6448 family protein [Geopsychrobacter electrodiphilus]|uniref:DUF6448 family protein n=1 Tax=Geopsychrobacter electrodiphilus TaxID=225196 RepID=UPI00036F1290|nr:DUF6448 family protein [Geopsychrobacter electrodiphilus]
MKNSIKKTGRLMTLGLFALLVFTVPQSALAHCDTLDGPVVTDARTALSQKDITPILKWVSAGDEKVIRAAFAQTLALRQQSPEGKELADMYFFETLVRIHRAGEGAPYTGLKPGVSIDPAIVLTDQALATGSIDKVIEVMTGALAKGIRENFTLAYENQKHANDSVDAGREFVESYVVFTHYVEGLHNLIKADTAHRVKSVATSEGKHGH